MECVDGLGLISIDLSYYLVPKQFLMYLFQISLQQGGVNSFCRDIISVQSISFFSFNHLKTWIGIKSISIHKIRSNLIRNLFALFICFFNECFKSSSFFQFSTFNVIQLVTHSKVIDEVINTLRFPLT